VQRVEHHHLKIYYCLSSRFIGSGCVLVWWYLSADFLLMQAVSYRCRGFWICSLIFSVAQFFPSSKFQVTGFSCGLRHGGLVQSNYWFAYERYFLYRISLLLASA